MNKNKIKSLDRYRLKQRFFRSLIWTSLIGIWFNMNALRFELHHQNDTLVFSFQSAQAKKTKKSRKKTSFRSKTTTKGSRKRKNTSKKKYKVKQSSSKKTGVKSVWRKDGKPTGSRQRWQNTKSRIRQHLNQGKYQYNRPRNRQPRPLRSRSRPRSRAYFFARSKQTIGTQGQSSNPTSQANDQSTQSPRLSTQINTPLSPETYESSSVLTLNKGSWVDAIELELSSTLWDFNSALSKSEQDDWESAEAEARYQISPSVMYRGQLRLYSRLLDLDINYESKKGISLLSEQGSWLDIAFALPTLVPVLAPLSLSYRRVRFADGQVDLNDWQEGVIERQKFAMHIDRYEARWLLLDGPEQHDISRSQFSLFFAYDQRALPRHIYLEERVRLNKEESYSVYYGISDQLLWTPSDSYDLGAELRASLSQNLQVNFALSLGLGSYELLTPLTGKQLDHGSMAVLGFKAGLDYELPLSRFLSLKGSYRVEGRALSPTGLPQQLEQELEAEEWNLDELSLSFGTVDLLHRFGLSLVLRLAEARP